jgi:DNA-binding response OmpR family regulator
MQPEVETAPPEPPAPREVILVAEDEESIRSLVARVLAKQGYRVLEAADGEDALRQAAEFPGDINLVLTDVMLPQIRGTELVKRLRLTRPGIHALYVSGYSDDPELTPGNVPPTDGFLQKPFQLGVLVDTVKTLLGTRE